MWTRYTFFPPFFPILFLSYAVVCDSFQFPFSVLVCVADALLYYKTRSWLIIILLLVLQAWGSDEKASQGHEEKHWGWFRCVLPPTPCVVACCAIDLHLFTNILDVAWQVFFKARKTSGCLGFFGGASALRVTWQMRWESASLCLNLLL